MPFRLIAMDLDGTLLNSGRQISDRSLDVLRRAAGEGYLLVPATGRHPAILPPELERIPYSFLMAASGALVLERGTQRQIYRAEIPFELLNACEQVIRRHDVLCNYVTDGGAYMRRTHIDLLDSYGDPNLYWRRVFGSLHHPIEDFSRWMAQKPSVLKMNLFFRSGSAADETRRSLRRELEQIEGLDICSSMTGNLEIVHQSATKARALAALAGYLHIPMAEVIAFGDSGNDAEMLAEAGLGVAMANAFPEIIAAADCLTLSNDEDGVARGIERWVFGQTQEVITS